MGQKRRLKMSIGMIIVKGYSLILLRESLCSVQRINLNPEQDGRVLQNLWKRIMLLKKKMEAFLWPGQKSAVKMVTHIWAMYLMTALSRRGCAIVLIPHRLNLSPKRIWKKKVTASIRSYLSNRDVESI